MGTVNLPEEAETIRVRLDLAYDGTDNLADRKSVV